MAKVSIVVPVYNVEKYINKCVDSIIAQSFKDIEVILVDDKSPDKCPEICDMYANKDDRVKVVHHEQNVGTNGAILSGIQAATSQYIMFADSDDWVLEDYIETLYKIIADKKVEAVSSGYVEYCGDIKKEYFPNFTRTYNKKQIEDEIVTPYFERTENFHDSFGNSRVGKIYVKEVLIKASVGSNPELVMEEDVELNLRFLLECESIATVHSYAGYCYRIDRNTSITNQYTMKRLAAHMLAAKEMKKLALKYRREGKALGRFNPYRHLFNFLNADTDSKEKMLCVKTILESIPHSVLVENSVQELFIYLSSNIPLDYKLNLLHTVTKRLEQTDVLTPKQKDEYLVSFMFHYLKSNLSTQEKTKAIKKQKELLTDKKYLLEVSKTQPFMGKVSYILIYLGLERLLVSISNVT